MHVERDLPSRIGWELPPFYCPLERGLLHPRVAEIEERAVAWTDAFALYPDATERAWGLASHAAEFTSRIIPRGDVEPMVLFAEWNYWAFAADDWHDSGSAGPGAASRAAGVALHGARLARTVEAPVPGLLPPGPHTAALEDLAARTRAMLRPGQLRRFTHGVREWVFGATWQTANDERGVMPSLDEFTASRICSSGTRFLLTWCDVANGIDVPSDVLYSPSVQALTDAAGFVVSCDNDVLSYNKDDDQMPWEQNVVNVLAHQEGCTPAEALPAAYALRDRTMSLFVRLREQLGKEADEELARYLVSLEQWIAGNLAYHNRAPRYASPRNRNSLPVEGASYDITYSEVPSDPSDEPLPIPALAWWWQRLDG
ncbi:terpene synthase family protein [Streptomyces sp. NPDC059708]|uniref:terpene synthase family protein n=1 Tax=Streptomyces sp. NPDC059708 TaxID=3346916 RepID=UPI0036B06CA6